MASKLERTPSELLYCFDCFDWYVVDDWDEHCLAHVGSLSSKRCASITYCNVLVHPSFCPFCLGDERLRPSARYQSWTKEAKLWDHLTSHILACRWPLKCPHPLCNPLFDDETSFLYHLDDTHGLRMSPARKEAWPSGHNSKPLIRWIPEAKREKRKERERSDEIEEPLPGKRRALQTQVESLDACARYGTRDHEDPIAQPTQHISPLKLYSVNAVLDDDELPALSYGSFTPSPLTATFKSTDDISIEELGPPIGSPELPELSDVLDDPLVTQASEKEIPSLDEEFLFSQYLCSPPPESETEIIGLNGHGSVRNFGRGIKCTDLLKSAEEYALNDAVQHGSVELKSSPETSPQPRVALRLLPPKPPRKPKTRLRLSQPKKTWARSFSKHTKHRKQYA